MATITSPDLRQHLKLFTLILGFLLLLSILFVTRLTVLTIMIGIGVGVLLSPVMNFFSEKFKLPRPISAILLAFLFLLFVIGMGTGFYFAAQSQLKPFISQFPEILERAQEFSKEWLPEQVSQINWSSSIRRLATGAIFTIQTLAFAFAAFFLIMAVGLFTALRSKEYFESFLTVFPHYLRERYRMIGAKSAQALRNWFRSQVIVILVTGTLISLGLWALGIPFWLLLGLLTGLASLIPYVGAFTAGFMTVLVTLGSEPEKIGWVVILYLAVQEVENYLTLPLVMRKESKLPEVPLIAMMLILGQIFGVLGAAVAAPLLAVIRTLYWLAYVPKMNQAQPQFKS